MADDDDLKSLFRLRSEGDYEQVQKVAFTKWINKWLEKDGDRIENLYVDLTDGTKLLTLLRLFTGVKLPCEKGKTMTIFHKTQNIRTVLNFITKDRQIKTDGIVVADVVDGNPKIILGLVWRLILNFEVMQTKKDLLEWAQSVTQDCEGVAVRDFTHSWKDGRAFCAIISKHRPDLLDYQSCDFSQPLDCLERAFSIAEDELNTIRLIEPEDVCVSRPPDNVIMMYVSALKKLFPEQASPIPEPTPEPPVALKEYSTGYDTLLKWISTRQEQLASPDFPKTAEDTQRLLDKFRRQRAIEKEKEKRKKELGEMEEELTEFHRKHEKDFHLPQFTELEKMWFQYQSTGDTYESALEKHLQQQMEIDRGKKERDRKMISQCEEYTASYNLLLKWISSKQEQLARPDFPKTAEETERLLDRYRHQRVEEKEKEKRKNELGTMEQELTEFQQRQNRDFYFPQFAKLEMKWSQYQSTSDSYESALEKHLQQLMEIHHDIKEQERKMISKCEEYSAGYNLLLQWISTRQEQLASPVFPKTAEETQRLLDRFKHQKVEEKENEKRKNQLGAMEQELTEFQRRHDKDFHLPQFAQLEMKWSQYQSASDSYERALEKHLQQLMEIDQDKKEQEVKMISQCEEYSAGYDLLLQWISSKQEQLTRPDFPKTAEETQRLLDKYRHQREDEEKEKEKRKRELGAMEQELSEFQQRHDKDFHLPQFAKLEMKWTQYQSTSDSYESALEKHLQQQMEIDRDKKEQEQKMIGQCEEYSAGYNILLQWISSKQEQLTRPDFPKTAEETQKLLDKYRHQRDEEKEKEKRKRELGAMEQELSEFQQRHDKDFHLPQFVKLEMKWTQYQSTSDSYESALEKHLQQQMEIDRDKKEQEQKMISQCEEYSAGYNLLLKWISSRQEQLARPDFPKTTEETQELLDKFRCERVEEKDKEKKKKELGVMEQRLIEFQRRHNKDFHLPQFSKLEKKWSQYQSTCDSYERALEKHLRQLMEIDRDKKEQERKMISQCEEYSAGYNLLLQWISSRQLQLESHDFPKTIEETQKLLGRFRHQRAEEKEKEKRKKELGAMEQELQQRQTDFHFPQFAKLEKKWSVYRSTSDGYESALKKHLLQLMEIDREKQKKVLSQCERPNDRQQQVVLKQIQAQLDKCHCETPFRMVQVGGYMYKFGTSEIHRMVRILRKTIMVRVGGGWEPLEVFLSKHDPCRKIDSSSRQRLTEEILSATADEEEVDVRPDQQVSMISLTNYKQRNGSSSLLLRPIDSTLPRPRSPKLLRPGISRPNGSALHPRDKSGKNLIRPSSPRSSDSSLTRQKAVPPRLDDSEQSRLLQPKSIKISESLSKAAEKETASNNFLMDSRIEFLRRCNVTLQEVQSLYGAHQIILVLSRGSRIPIPTRLLHQLDADYY